MGNWPGCGGSGSARRQRPRAGNKHRLVTTHVQAREPGQGARGHAAPDGGFMGCSDPKNGGGQRPQRGVWRPPRRGAGDPGVCRDPPNQGVGTPKRGTGTLQGWKPPKEGCLNPKQGAGTPKRGAWIPERGTGTPKKRAKGRQRSRRTLGSAGTPRGCRDRCVPLGTWLGMCLCLLLPSMGRALGTCGGSGDVAALGTWRLWGRMVPLGTRGASGDPHQLSWAGAGLCPRCHRPLRRAFCREGTWRSRDGGSATRIPWLWQAQGHQAPRRPPMVPPRTRCPRHPRHAALPHPWRKPR